MEIYWAIFGTIFGLILANLARDSQRDAFEDKIRRRSFALGYLHGKRRSAAVRVEPDPVKCKHCGMAHHSSYCEE